MAVVNLVPYVTGAEASSSSAHYPYVVISTAAKLITLKLIFVKSSGHKIISVITVLVSHAFLHVTCT